MAASQDASNAQGAQITLDSFNIPEFPPEARGLKALTLTSSISAERYQAELTKPFNVSKTLPSGIESLTLQLFSLGYPEGFLTALAGRLPNLKSVVIYSQLFSGLTNKSQQDAVEFFKRLPSLRALHLLDVFAKPGLFHAAAQWLKYNTSNTPGEARRGLMFLEVNYTFDHTDEAFTNKIATTELLSLIGPGLISCSLNISPPEPDPSHSTSTTASSQSQGVMAFNKDLGRRLLDALIDEEMYPRGLRALNATLYTLSVEGLATVLAKHKNVMMLSVTIETDPGRAFKQKLLRAIEQCEHLEQVDFVLHPTIPFFVELTQSPERAFSESIPTLDDINSSSSKLAKLKSFKADILRSSQFGKVSLVKKDNTWVSEA